MVLARAGWWPGVGIWVEQQERASEVEAWFPFLFKFNFSSRGTTWQEERAQAATGSIYGGPRFVYGGKRGRARSMATGC
jgi:hypothetical protein